MAIVLVIWIFLKQFDLIQSLAVSVMTEEKKQPDLQAYTLAWVLWCFTLYVPVVLLAIVLYIVNMFARVFPVSLMHYGVAIVLALYSFVLIAIAWFGLRKRSKGLPAWEPCPLPFFAVRLQKVARLID
ncbi:MAG: hypothetical protein ACIAXF_16205 [Phycisphaerales bacterium JB063]